jgi:hypothetical protein
MLPFNKSDQVPSKQGVVFRREISAWFSVRLCYRSIVQHY